MKNLTTIVIITLSSLAALSALAGGGAKYEEIMASTINELYTAEEIVAIDGVSNKFNRIGDAEKDQWLPYYYASLANLFKAFRIEDLKEKDLVLDQAQVTLKKAADIEANNSEIVALTGFINMIKIEVDPGTRGQSMSPKIMADFGRAMQLDPNNPRATLFMGQMQYGMAQFFGQGQEEACLTVLRSIELFDKVTDDKPLMPTWGKSSALQYQKMCNLEVETPANSE